jgi:hypothetical protein
MNCGSGNGGSPADRARSLVGSWAAASARAVHHLTVRKYTLPDKDVASQVLMYRQLLHCKCRPGLKLSRDYQGTTAQRAVKHMPWWCEGMEETGKMVISYDNLVRRLWLRGAVLSDTRAEDLEALCDDGGMPPVPHEYWVSRLGFQQTDPVTDFRSGGVLSLAMMVWMAESSEHVHARFVKPTGDASVLPFGITSINVTDMMAKFLMLSKSTDRMDALLSQKPFWQMFSDPNAILACQELAMDMLADVVQEVRAVRRAETCDAAAAVTVFDFSHILAVTEHRVEYDLLGAGPLTVAELRQIHKRLKVKYQQQLDAKLQRIAREMDDGGTKPAPAEEAVATAVAAAETTPAAEPRSSSTAGSVVKEHVLQSASGIGAAASSLAGNVLQTLTNPTSVYGLKSSADETTANGGGDVPPPAFATPPPPPPPAAAASVPDLLSDSSSAFAEKVPANKISPTAETSVTDETTDQFGAFRIGEDEEDDFI